MKNAKRILSLVLVLIICFSICACSNTKGTGSNEITYSNLVGSNDINKLSNLFINNGVDKTNVEKIMSSVKYYNTTIGSNLLTTNGKIDLSAPIPAYDSVAIDDMWLKNNEAFIGYNCRLTAFELMKDFITVNDTSKSNPASLFMDEDALFNSTDEYLTDEELAKFEALYSTINTTSSTDTNEQYEIQRKYWDGIGVRFSNNEGISLISVYIHNHFSEDENELIIGHTGVLIGADNGYYFFEKLSFQLPYQLIRFNTKDELKRYLMSAYDTDTTGESAKPFILENDKLM